MSDSEINYASDEETGNKRHRSSPDRLDLDRIDGKHPNENREICF